MLSVEIDNVQILDGFRERQTGVEFKGDGTQAVIIEVNATGKTDDGIDLVIIFRLKLILHVGSGSGSGRDG